MLKATILYGSQTGNAHEVAERLWRELKRFRYNGPVMSMDSYNIENLPEESMVIFICSTTGQGEEPDNMKSFWKHLLKKSLPPDCLVNLKFAVLGLGDSSYPKYNFAAKRLHKRLLHLGASPILNLTLANDQDDLGYDAVADPWIVDVSKYLLEIYPLPDSFEPLSSEDVHQPRWKVEIVKDQNEGSEIPVESKVAFKARIKSNTRVTAQNHFQDVRLIEFCASAETHYSPGDVINIKPNNLPEQVQEFFDVLNENGVDISPQTVIELVEKDPNMPIPDVLKRRVSFKQLCESYWDLNAVPRRYAFHVLSQISTSDLEKEKCLEFCSSEGQQSLYNYCNRPRRTIVEVLRDFPHATKNLTIDRLFEILFPIKPRAFSIASSPLAHPNEIHILVAVVKYQTIIVKERLGLCSNWLAGLETGAEIPLWISKGSFHFLYNTNLPKILIGPGTGVAPFRSYLLECEQKFELSKNAFTLFFGCRNRKGDFHFEKELTRLYNEDKLNLICAFSRDQSYKIYVQHKILEHGKMVWDILGHRQGSIFLAGSSNNMPNNVRDAILDICMHFGKMDRKEAERYVYQLETTNRYQTETWG